MVKASINTYGSVNKEVGWSSKEVKLEQERVTIEDVLRSAELGDGKTLFNLVADESGIKESYMIMINGRPLQNAKELKMEIKSGDAVTAMDFVLLAGGG